MRSTHAPVLPAMAILACAAIVETFIFGVGGGFAVKRIPTLRTAQQTTEQILIPLIVTRRETFVRFQPCMGALKYLCRNESRDGNANPVLLRTIAGTGVDEFGIEAVIPGLLGGSLTLDDCGFAIRGLAGVSRVAQHRPDHGPLPPSDVSVR